MLTFKTALQSEAAGNPENYAVLSGEKPVQVESVDHEVGAMKVTLYLGHTLRTGEKIVVEWRNLRDIRDKPVPNERITLTAR